jgi:hypothetical protein
MSMDQSVSEGQTPTVSPGNYSPVTINVKDTVGSVLLGILSVLLFIGWMRSEARYRNLITQQRMQTKGDPQDVP